MTELTLLGMGGCDRGAAIAHLVELEIYSSGQSFHVPKVLQGLGVESALDHLLCVTPPTLCLLSCQLCELSYKIKAKMCPNKSLKKRAM